MIWSLRISNLTSGLSVIWVTSTAMPIIAGIVASLIAIYSAGSLSRLIPPVSSTLTIPRIEKPFTFPLCFKSHKP